MSKKGYNAEEIIHKLRKAAPVHYMLQWPVVATSAAPRTPPGSSRTWRCAPSKDGAHACWPTTA